MTAAAAHAVLLELTRIDDPDDPYAFRFEPQGYTLRRPGGDVARFDLPWTREFLADLDALRRPGRDPAVVQRVGEVMQRALRPTGWEALGAEIRGASDAGRPVHITIRANAAELYALPWELLTLGPSGQHLGELPGVLLRSEWPGTVTTVEHPSPPLEGGRVLLAWSAAGGPVPAAEHQQAIARAWIEGHVDFDPATDVLGQASAAGIADTLACAEAEGRPIAVLHLLAHGGRVGSTFGLVMDSDEGAASVVDGGRLRQLLAPHARTLRLVVLAACDSGNSGDPGNHLGSVAQTLHRAGLRSVIASRAPLSVAGSIVLAEALYRGLLVDLRSLEGAVTDARARLARRAESLDWASLQLYARASDGDDTRPVIVRPYRGLLAFEARHRRFFFGREAERDETVSDLQALIDGDRPRVIVVVGASGTGKSSMVLAGVVPDVDRLRPRRAGPWEVLRMVPGAAPAAALRGLLAARVDGERPLLLVVDQFEELFTHTEDPAERSAFVRTLWSLSQGDTGVHCVLTLRVDFLGHCGEIIVDDAGLSLDRIAYDEAHRVFVARMAPEQVRAAITGPAAHVGLTFEPGLIERILVDVGQEPGALPLLQYTLDRLWRGRDGGQLTAAVYDQIGGLLGALERDADQLLGRLDPGQRRQARRLMTQLVGISEDEAVDTRRRVEVARLGPADAVRRPVHDEVLRQLVDARLLVRSEKGGAATLEIAHEALIRRWDTLRGWIAEDRVKLTELETTKTWVRQWQEHGTLLTGAQLGYAVDIVQRYGDDVDAATLGLVDASEAQRRRQRRIVGAVIAVLVVGVLGLAGISLYAFDQQAAADEQRARADAQAQIAEEKKTAAEAATTRAEAATTRAKDTTWIAYARAMRGVDPTRALLGLRSVDSVATTGWPQEAVETLQEPIARVILRGHEAAITSASFSPDGARVVTSSNDGTARVWSAESGTSVVLRGRATAIGSACLSPDGQRIVTASAHFGAPTEDDPSEVLLWTAAGRELTALEGHTGPVVSVSFSPDGGRIVTASADGTARVWTADGGEAAVLTGHRGDLTSARFSADGRRIVTASTDGTARVWTADGAGPPVILDAGRSLWSASFDHDGRRVVSHSLDDGTVRVWSADGSGKPVVLAGNGSAVWSASFSADGQWLVIAANDGVARVRRADGVGEAVVLSGHSGQVLTASFSRDGQRILTGAQDGTARLWSADGHEEAVLRGDAEVLGVEGAIFSPDGGRVLTTSVTARIWDVRVAAPVVLAGHEAGEDHYLHTASFSPDGRRILTASTDGTTRLWSADGRGEAVVVQGEATHCSEQCSVVTDDGRFVTGSDDGTVRVWSAEGRVVATLEGHEGPVLSVNFSADGRRVVTASADGTARVWGADGRARTTLRGHEHQVLSASFSPDGERVLTTSHDRTARLWRADGAGAPTIFSHGDDGQVDSAAFSADGRRIVTASRFGGTELRVWDVDGVAAPLILESPENGVRSASLSPDGAHVLIVADFGPVQIRSLDESGATVVLRGEDMAQSASFSPDGRRIITVSGDDQARVWSAETGLEALVLGGEGIRMHWGSVFSPDGRRVLTRSRDAKARVWTVDAALLRETIESVSTACVPLADRIRYLGEDAEEACEAYARCEREHGRPGECGE